MFWLALFATDLQITEQSTGIDLTKTELNLFVAMIFRDFRVTTTSKWNKEGYFGGVWVPFNASKVKVEHLP